MDYILHGLSYHYAVLYLDGTTIFSFSFHRHFTDLRQILHRLQKYNCQLNLKICNLASQQLEYLCHTITRDGTSPETSLIDALERFPSRSLLLSTAAVKEAVASFVALGNFIHDFHPLSPQLQLRLSISAGKEYNYLGHLNGNWPLQLRRTEYLRAYFFPFLNGNILSFCPRRRVKLELVRYYNNTTSTNCFFPNTS